MTQKTTVIEILDEYFKTKGKILRSREYQLQDDTPIRYQVVVNLFGNWPRMEKIMMARREAQATTNVDEIVKERNRVAAAAEAAAKAAGEDQAAKLAKDLAEKAEQDAIAIAAATPETMNALKAAANEVKPAPKKEEAKK